MKIWCRNLLYLTKKINSFSTDPCICGNWVAFPITKDRINCSVKCAGTSYDLYWKTGM